MNTKTLELRNLLGDAPEGVKCCSVCGKPEARATKDVKALPHHAAALASVNAMGQNLPAQFKWLTKILGARAVDFVTRKSWNAQLESIHKALTLAREEHDAYVPEKAEAVNSRTVKALVETLALLGVQVVAEDHTPSTVNLLAENVNAHMKRLMEIKASV